ncbi:MAG TPA: hypothetical protein VL401_02725 [Alphaproteobacteria bacterium]|jgi:glucose-6-phosphate 1-dehydrogenase|nr:hypothetical protein [Alphaproteobacteria bacterium]
MAKSLFILFGATGSLAQEKILPALKKLHNENIEIVLYARRDFEADFPYIKGELNDLTQVEKLVKEKNISKIYFYISLPPNLYPEVLNSIDKLDKNFEKFIALEKPFGNSLEEAKKLAEQIQKTNSKFYLVDHYLAKEPVIEMEKVDVEKIEKIKIAILETADVSQRSTFYDEVGAIKDVGQNHMLNMLAKLIGNLDKVYYKKGSLELGQYEGYSKIETYFKAHFGIENTDIDIEFESGKKLKEDLGFIKVEFKDGGEYIVKIKPTERPIQREAYDYILEDFISGENKFSVSVQESLRDWEITEEILQDKSKTEIKIY